METKQEYTLRLTKEELLVLTKALSCTEHLSSSTYQEKLTIQNSIANRVLELLRGGK